MPPLTGEELKLVMTALEGELTKQELISPAAQAELAKVEGTQRYKLLMRAIGEYRHPKDGSIRNFDLPDAARKPHLIRAPEKSEKPCVRDYPVEGGELGEFTNVILPQSGPGKLANWQVHPLPGGKMAVTAALSEKGGYDPDDLELYVSFFDGAGKWSAPVCVTRNQSKQSGFNKETTAGNTIGALKSHKPRFASVVLARDGKPCLLLVDNEDTIVGVSSTGATTGGWVVTGTGSLRTDNPAVYFLKL